MRTHQYLPRHARCSFDDECDQPSVPGEDFCRAHLNRVNARRRVQEAKKAAKKAAKRKSGMPSGARRLYFGEEPSYV